MSIAELRIGLDLDGVVFNYTEGLRQASAKALNVDPNTLPDPAFYSLFKSGWFESEEQFKEIHSSAVDQRLYRDLPTIEGASETLWRLSNLGAHIHIITSRFVVHGQHAQVLADTANSLDMHNIPFRSIGFDAHKVNHMADVYIDDSPANIHALRDAGRDVICFTADYNLGIDGPRANNWDDVWNYIINKFATEEEKAEIAALNINA